MAKLTPEEEAIAFDRQTAREAGNDPLTTKEVKEIMEQRKADQKLSDENTKGSHLEKFVAFSNDPLAYLHSLVSHGDFTGKGEKIQLFTLMTLLEISKSLKELVLTLKAKK